MSSICSAESAASASDLREPELFTQLPSASESPSAKPSCESTGPTRPSTTMSEPSRQIDLEESTSSVADSPASPGVLPGSSEARKMTVTSGRRWLPLLKSYGLHGSLARMSAALLASRWGSSAAFLTWKASGTKPSHLLFQLAPSMPRTDATEFGLLPTPTTPSDGGERSGDRAGTGDLNYMARKGLWPTPRTTGLDGGSNSRKAAKARGMWPTLVARDHKGQGMSRERRLTREPDNLCSWTKKHEGSGALNPTWVEWLMGFPPGWTDLKPSETPSSRKSSSRSGER